MAAIHSGDIGLRPRHEEIFLKLGVLKWHEGIGGGGAQRTASCTPLQHAKAHKCKQQHRHGVESHGCCWISFPTLGLQLRRRKPSTPSSLRTTDVATMVSTLFLSGRRPCNPCKLPVVGSTESSTFKCTRVFIRGWGTGQFPCTCRVLSILVCTLTVHEVHSGLVVYR